MERKKLIFLDIDGTLAMPGKPVSTVNKEAIARARRNGHKVFLCTGRHDNMLPSGIDPADYDGGIFCAGARIAVGGQIIYDKPMKSEMRDRIVHALDEQELYFHYETGSGTFASDREVIDLNSEPEQASSELERLRDFLKRSGTQKLTDYREEGVYKIVFIIHASEEGKTLRAALPDMNVVLFENLNEGLSLVVGEVADADVTKATAMELLCAEYGMTREDCIAFGDSMNDADILKEAGIGIAMGNSVEEVKRLADHVCEGCEEDGVAKEMMRLGLLR